MASLEQRNGNYRVIFRFGGDKHSRSLKTRSERAANASLARLEDNIRRVELGLLSIPEDADVAAFLLSDGQAASRPQKLPRPTIRTLKQLCDAFVESIPQGSIEQSTLDQLRTHISHLTRVVGGEIRFESIGLANLQLYVDRRSKDKGLRGRTLSAATIKKEITTLSSIWNWAREGGHVLHALPKKGLRYPKTEEKPPFQTWAEIERQIERGGLSEGEQGDLWECLFLTGPEVAAVLEHVKQHARHPFLFPMVVFAAHTGARRSELLRSRIDDVDLDGETIVIREKKRVQGKRTTRRVPISPFLKAVLEEWFADHPGGQFTFCHGEAVARSRKDRPAPEALTPDEAHDHFKRTLAGSKWVKLRGWHVFRHSFCSNCAAAGIDQRIINAWVGHQTEEMVRRYRHLIPNQQQEAIRRVFACGA